MSVSLVQDLVWILFSFCSALNLRLVIKDDSDCFNIAFGNFVFLCSSSLFISPPVCLYDMMEKAWILVSEESRESHFCALTPPLWEKHPWLFKERRHVKVSSPLHPSSLTYPSPLSWRCLQWERPDALLEERERFIEDWRDRALTVFRWRLPAFFRACLLQQHWYVRLEPWGHLSCIRFGNNQRAPGFIENPPQFQMFTPIHSDIHLNLHICW